MEIVLLSPTNNSCPSIIPKMQKEIIAALPTEDKVIENNFNWRDPNTKYADNSYPDSIIFTWKFDGSLYEITDVVFYISESSAFENAERYIISAGQMFLSLTNFKINTEYFWKMVAFSDGIKKNESETFHFITSDELPQWYFIDGTSNVRDIGGWNTQSGILKSGMIFRGCELNREFRANQKALGFLHKKLGIKTDLDLRFDVDVEDVTGSPIPDANWIHIPVYAYADIDNDIEKAKYAKIFKLFSYRENYPFYIHCIAGADRTGTVIILLKALLGVSYEDIAFDYELTSLSVFGPRSRHQVAFVSLIELLLKYGSDIMQGAENYLLSCGISQEEISNIRTILTK